MAAAQLAFEMGTELGYRMHLLDIGGGFPGTEDTRTRFEEVPGSRRLHSAGRERGWRVSLGLAHCRGAELTEGERLLPIQVAAVVNSALDLYFPDGCGVEIVATPGRYYVTSAFTFAASITAREEVPVEQPSSDGRWDGGTGPPVCPSPPNPLPAPLQRKSVAARRASCITSATASTAPSAASCLTAPAPDLSCTR